MNRVLFPYFGAFAQLIHDGADFRQIDKARAAADGTCLLLDVVGIDGVRAQGVMAAGFERMQQSFGIIKKLFEAGVWARRPVRAFTVTKRIRRVSQKPKPRYRSASLMRRKPDPTEQIVNRMMVPCAKPPLPGRQNCRDSS